MPDQQEEIVRAYLEQVVRIQQEDARAITQGDLDSIALDLGLTDADLKRLRKRYQEYVERAEGLMQFGNHNAAIVELRQAVALAPTRSKGFALLAHAHEQRYVVAGEREDREAALEAATQALRFEPSNPEALRVLTVLSIVAKSGWKISRKGARVVALLVMLFMVGVIVMVILSFIDGP